MAVTFTQLKESGDRHGSTKATEIRKTLVYLSSGSDVEEEVAEEVNNQLPAGWTTFSGVVLLRSSMQIVRMKESRYKVTINYRHPNHERSKDDPQSGDPILALINGEIGGGTVHVARAISQTRYGAAPPNHGLLIEVTEDGPKGVDIPAGGLTFTITWVYEAGVVDLAFIRDVVALADPANTNDSVWYDFAVGELLYLGATFRERNNGDFEFQHKFKAGKNEENFDVDGINVDSKSAHQYLWVSSKITEDATAKKRVETIDGVHVATVHPAGDFDKLQMGGS